jgi:DnaJ-class molecular chaperone
MAVNCPTCDGTGRQQNFDPCNDCDGLGFVNWAEALEIVERQSKQRRIK